MDTFILSLADARLLYPGATGEAKAKLEAHFGKEQLTRKRHFTDIKNFEDACEVKGINPKYVVEKLFNAIPDTLREYRDFMVASLKRVIIAEVIRGDWKADYSDSRQVKWHQWYKWKDGVGFVFDTSDSTYDYSLTYSGSRLDFANCDESDYFGKQFIELHRVVLQYKAA